jgi:hypothetical protein
VPESFIVDGGGGRVRGTRPVKRPKQKAGPKAVPEPHGRGLRVVMQRLPVTAPGVLAQPFMFQVAPLDEYARQYGWDFTDYDTVASGYHTRPGSRQLATISFDSLFVDDDYAFVINKQRPFNPVALADELRAIGDAQTPFQLLAGQPNLWGVYYDTNMAATMRSLRVSEKHGEPDARYFTIGFTEFRGLPASQLDAGLLGDLSRSGNRLLAVLSIPELTARTATLRLISKKYYGTTSLWSAIAKASGLAAPGSVNLRDYYKNYHPQPKITVPVVQRKG